MMGLMRDGSPPFAFTASRIAGQVRHRRHAGKVLRKNPGREERNFHRIPALGVPPADCGDGFFRHHPAIEVAHQVLEQNTDGIRKPGRA